MENIEFKEVDVTNIQKIDEQIKTEVQNYKDYEIKTPEEYTTAGEMMKKINERRKSIEEARKEIVDPINKGLRKVNELFKVPLDRLSGIKCIISGSMVKFDAQMEIERKKQEEKRRKEEEKKAEREKAKLEKKAAKLEEQGKLEEAEEIAMQAEEVEAQTVVVAPIIDKPKGLRKTTRWYGRVTSMKALVKAVAEEKAPIGFLQENQSVLNKQASIIKDTMKIPGVEFYSETKVEGSR